jgi:OmcA/MtrC family decaheme c-type cytochrome
MCNENPNLRSTHWVPWLATVLMVVSLLLTGCFDGTTGDRGPAGVEGPPGQDGRDLTAPLSELSITFEGVEVSSPPVATFTVTDQDGMPYTDLAANQLGWTIVKLVPDGPTHTWRSYINRVRDARPAAVKAYLGDEAEPAMDSAIQATSESGGTLEHLGGGKYQYTFATDITNVTTPVEVAYEPTRTHRVGVQVSDYNNLPLVNAWIDFIPASPGAVPTVTRDIVATETCNSCHDNLGKHGGSARTEVGFCVTCHNPGTTEPNSGESLDLAVLIHKLHRGTQLPRVAAGHEYLVWGFSSNPQVFSNVVYPFEARTQHAGPANRTMACQKCHTTDEDWAGRFHVSTTPDGDAWKERANMRACASCHEDVPGLGLAGAPWIDETKTNHSFVTQDTNCLGCHSHSAKVEGQSTPLTPIAAHRLDLFERAQQFIAMVNGNPVFDAEAGTLTTKLRLEDADGEDRTKDATFRFFIAAGSKEYRNYDTNVSAANIGGISVPPLAVADANGFYEVVTNLAPEADAFVAVGGSGMLSVAGSVSDNDDILWFPNQTAAFAITDPVPVHRRTVASMDGCRNCHMGVHGHGGTSGRDENLQTCAVCHNSNFFKDNDGMQNTGMNWRNYGAGHKRNSGLMTMVHAIHNNSAHRAGIEGKEVKYPAMAPGAAGIRDARTCTKCHTDTGYQLPIAEGVTGPTFALLGDYTEVGDVTTHRKFTPTVGACASCHVDYSKVDFETGFSNDAAWNHMKAMGGGESVNWSYDFPDTQGESCVMCHGPGKELDVKLVHGIN